MRGIAPGIKPLHRYSTTEQVVGTWIDGKTIYEKTINLNTNYINSGSGTWVTISDVSNELIAVNADYVVGFRAMGNTGQAITPAVQFVNNVFYWYLEHITDLNGNVINYAVIQYTKTTD